MRRHRGLVALGCVLLAGTMLAACRSHPAPPQSAGGYATAILDHAPLPPGAIPSRHLPVPLSDDGGTPGIPAMVQVHRSYLLPKAIDVGAFVQAHIPPGASSIGNGSFGGPGVISQDTYSLQLASTRRAAYVQLDYSVVSSVGGNKELRVDVLVKWVPIRVVHLPAGVVTVTTYRKVSIFGSSDPATAVLNGSQAAALRSEIASLPNAAGGGCHEDALLFRISVASNQEGPLAWTATGDACPGDISFASRPYASVILNNTCSMRQLVASFFPQASMEWRNTRC